MRLALTPLALNPSVSTKCGVTIATLTLSFMVGSSAIAQPLTPSLSLATLPPLSVPIAHKNAYRIETITAAIERSPNNANLYNSRGWYYFQQGSYEAAIADYTRVETLGLDTIEDFYRPTVYYVRGLSYAQLGRYEAAIADLNIALEMYNAKNEIAAIQEIETTIEKLETLTE
ncbi:MAG: tetratricopeptide repeat protein [Phormidesmis sp.]